MRAKPAAFTLIELLIVVAIIAILAAIAVPNFLQAQVRSKISRMKADMRSLATAVESYAVDHNDYPAPWGLLVDGRDSLALLSTPVAYVSSGDFIDIFARPSQTRFDTLVVYEAVNTAGRIIESPPQSSYSSAPDANPVAWWWVASRGPDQGFGFGTPVDDPEGNLWKKFFRCDIDRAGWLSVVYDPTNGTVSLGNLYRPGGAVRGFAGKTMH